MGIKQRLEADIKAALLGGDKDQVTILRTLKSVILEAEIAKGKRDTGLEEDELIQLLAKEAKKRQDAVELYISAGEQARADRETHEKQIIDAYLPAQISDDELNNIIDEVMAALDGEAGPQVMGKAIGLVRQKTEGKADGGRIASCRKSEVKSGMIIFTGVAGSGKSVQGRMLADYLGFPWLSTGEFLRMLVSGQKRHEMLKGKLLGDKEIIRLVQKIFSLIDTHQEFILDGFPRTVAQADWLLSQVKHGQLHITGVIHMVAAEEAVEKRLLSRGRADDNKQAIRERFDEYQQSMLPILEAFKKNGVRVHDIDAEQSVEAVFDDHKESPWVSVKTYDNSGKNNGRNCSYA